MKLLEDKETALAKWCLDTCLRYGAREARVTLSKSEENTVSVRDASVDKIYSSLENWMKKWLLQKLKQPLSTER